MTDYGNTRQTRAIAKILRSIPLLYRDKRDQMPASVDRDARIFGIDAYVTVYKALALTAIIRYIPKELLTEALNVAIKIDITADQRAYRYRHGNKEPDNPLDHIVQALTEDTIPQAIDLITKSKTETALQVLFLLAPRLSEDLQLQALNYIEESPAFRGVRSATLSTLISSLSQALIPRALSIVINWAQQRSADAFVSLAALIPRLSNSDISRAYSVILENDSEDVLGKCDAIIAILPYLSPEARQELPPLITRTLRNRVYLASMFWPNLRPHLDQKMIAQVIKSVEAIPDRVTRISLLAEMADDISAETAQVGIADIIEQGAFAHVEDVLGALVPKLQVPLEMSQVEGIVAIFDSLEFESQRARLLNKVGAYLPAETTRELTHQVSSVATSENDVKSLLLLAETQGEESLVNLLKMISALKNRLDADEALVRLIPKLPKQLIDLAFSAVRATSVGISTKGPWGALAAIVPRLPERLLGEAVDIAKGMDQSWRGSALIALAARVPEKLTVLIAQLALEDVEYNESFGGVEVWQTIERGLDDLAFAQLISAALNAPRMTEDNPYPWGRNSRIRVLCALFFTARGIAHDDLRAKLMAEIYETSDPVDRAELLLRLSPFIASDEGQAALADAIDLIVQNFQDRWTRSLERNIQNLPDRLVRDGFAAPVVAFRRYIRSLLVIHRDNAASSATLFIDSFLNSDLMSSTPRYTDVDLLYGHVYQSELAFSSDRVPDDEPMRHGEYYTFGVAIRATPIGIRAVEALRRAVVNHHSLAPASDIYVLLSPLVQGLRFLEPLAKVQWRLDSDSNTALFHAVVDTDRVAEGAIEIRLYDEHLDLLDLVHAHVVLVPNEYTGLVSPRLLSWPSKRVPLNRDSIMVNVDRHVSIHVRTTFSGYEFEILIKSNSGDVLKVPFRSTITPGDLTKLLRQVRDYWTKLVLTTYAERTSVTLPTFEGYLLKLKDLGVQAWGMLFGTRYADQKGSSETLGDLMIALALPEGCTIQITHADTSPDFVFPWTLLYPPVEQCDVDPKFFWGVRFRIEQVTRGSAKTPPQDQSVEMLFILDESFSVSELHQRKIETYASIPDLRLVVTGPICDEQALLDGLTARPAPHFVYFFCHGFASNGCGMAEEGVRSLRKSIEAIPEGSPERKALETLLRLTAQMNEDSWMFIGGAHIRQAQLAHVKFFNERRPIVFLNMCQSADLMPSMSSGFVRLFLDHNAACVIGTESPMTAVFASAFAEKVFENLIDGADVGEALRKARGHFMSRELRNPLGLAYTLYGRAFARLYDKSFAELLSSPAISESATERS